jgi:iron complex transport system ATP-binding protein
MPEPRTTFACEAHALMSGRGGVGLHAAVDFSVDRAACLCILGRNGAGKSTLIQTLVGLLPPVAGRVRWAGAEQADAQRVAYVSQRPIIPEGMTLAALLALGAYRHWGTAAPTNEATEATLAQVGLEGMGARLLHTLSGGEQQRAMLARALMQGADLLVLDEPTAHLDLAQRHAVLALLTRMRTSGTAVIFSSHAPEDAIAVADHVLLIGRERMRWQRAESLGADDVHELYGVPVRAVGEGRGRVFVPI